jgi:hypothetical protein
LLLSKSLHAYLENQRFSVCWKIKIVGWVKPPRRPMNDLPKRKTHSLRVGAIPLQILLIFTQVSCRAPRFIGVVYAICRVFQKMQPRILLHLITTLSRFMKIRYRITFSMLFYSFLKLARHKKQCKMKEQASCAIPQDWDWIPQAYPPALENPSAWTCKYDDWSHTHRYPISPGNDISRASEFGADLFTTIV